MRSQTPALALVLAVLVTHSAHAQVVQTDCEPELDAKLKDTFNLAAAAGSVTYKKIMDRALACMQGGTCSKSEVLVRLQEMMVDEEAVDFQRRKVALMKAFAADAGPRASACVRVRRSLPVASAG